MINLNELKPGQIRSEVNLLTDKKIVTTAVEKAKDGKVFMRTKQRILHRMEER